MHDPRGMGVEQCHEYSTDLFLPYHTIHPGDVVFDIGAGVGEATLLFSKMVGPAGKVVAVEAHPRTFAMLDRVCQLNSLRNVELIHAAVMDSNQPVMISDTQGTEGYLMNRVGVQGIQTPSVTLSDLVTELQLTHIDFLKTNIEGAEVAALQGARDVLPIVRHAAIGCHDFLADQTGDESYRTKDTVNTLLVEAGFTVASRAGDPCRWAADYLYASR